MSHQNIVVTVRLSDVEEIDQPDPICLPAGELATWRHFEALLKSMYKEPPPIIRVCYLDDESDWIELSSDTELWEAIKVAQDTDEILQLQVKRTDFSDQTFESTISPLTPGADNGPHVTPLQTTYYKDKQDILVYPHPCVYPLPPSSSSNTASNSYKQPLLVYPHPNTSTTPTPTTHRKPNENVLVLEANGNTASIQNRPDLSTEEKMRRLKDRLSSKGEKREEAEKGLNTLSSFKEMWQQASNYSSEDKVKFMKIFVSDNDNGPKEDNTPASKTPSGEGDDEQKEKGRDPNNSIVIVKGGEPTVVAPLLQRDFITSSSDRQVQDPFEFVSSTAEGARKSSEDLEQIHLNLQPGSILKPQKPGSNTSSKSVTVDMDDKELIDQKPPPIPARPAMTGSGSSNGNNSSNGEQRRAGGDDQASPSNPLLRPSSQQQQQMFVKASAVVGPPPMPQVRQFMEGAQSGANAVAIEIPEGYHQHHDGAAQKDEDVVTASGGAACNSSSAETGEALVNRPPSQEGAAVCTKVVSAGQLRLRVARTLSSSTTTTSTTTTTSSSKKSRKSATGDTSTNSKPSTEDAKTKGTSSLSSSLSSSSKRKSSLSSSASSSQDKKSSGSSSSSRSRTHTTRRSRSLNEEDEDESRVHVVADVESGEKVVKEREAALQYHEFTKYMKRMKKDLHSAIVKDVAKVSRKLLDKKLCPSARCDASTCCRDENSDVLHECIDCDHCCCHIRGIRYKCGNCANYDLCERCEAIPDVHDPTHVMLKLRKPVTGAGFVNGQRVPLLREIIYQQFSEDDDDDNDHDEHHNDDNNDDRYQQQHVVAGVVEVDAVNATTTSGGAAVVEEESIPLIPLTAALPLTSDSTTTTGVSRVVDKPRKVVAADGVDFFVWDSTFDTDRKNLYPVDAEGDDKADTNNRRRRRASSGSCSSWETNIITALETETTEESQLRETFSDSEWKRLYDLLCLQAEQGASAEKETETAAVEPQTQTQIASVDDEEVAVVVKEEEEEKELLVDAKGGYYSGGLLQRTASNQDENDNAEQEVEVAETNLPPSSFLEEEEEDDAVAALESDDHTSSLEIVNAEDDEDDNEAYEELAGSNDEERREQEVESDGIGGYQMLDHHDLCDSDTSDDFCVLDPPSRDELEAYTIETPLIPLTASTLCCEEQVVVSNLQEQENVVSGTDRKTVEVVDVQEERVVGSVDCPPQSVEEVQDQVQAVTETMDVLLTNACQAVETQKDALPLDENTKRTEEEKKKEENGVADDGQVEEKVGSVGEEKEEVEEEEEEDDILVKMNAEERRCFLEMVQSLKDRAEDLEKELKSRKEEDVVVAAKKEEEGEERQVEEGGEEIEYRMILEEKQREAARENEKLDAALRKDESERMARSSSHNKRKENQSGGSAAGSKRSKATPTLMEMALKKSTPTSTPIDISYGGKGAMKDTDSQTLGGPSASSSSDPAAQASQMLQQVASGMSKAAGAAYHTAKDVFYSLQAKQHQVVPGVIYSKPPSNQATGWKPQANTWTPPSSVWTPPADTFVPPKSSWTPPKSEWTTPKSDWTGSPKSEWTPSKSTWTPPKSEWTGPKSSEWTPPVGFYQEPQLEEPRRQQPVTAVSASAANADADAANDRQDVTDPKTPAPKSQKQPQEAEAVKKQSRSHNDNDSGIVGGGLTNDKESASTITSPVARPRTVDKQRPTATTTTATTTTKDNSSTTNKSTPTAPLPPTTTTPTPQLSASHIADPALRRQVRGMHLLIEMGFANREQNRRLLNQHNGDVEKVVQVLLQEERGESGDHWAWQRH